MLTSRRRKRSLDNKMNDFQSLRKESSSVFRHRRRQSKKTGRRMRRFQTRIEEENRKKKEWWNKKECSKEKKKLFSSTSWEETTVEFCKSELHEPGGKFGRGKSKELSCRTKIRQWDNHSKKGREKLRKKEKGRRILFLQNLDGKQQESWNNWEGKENELLQKRRRKWLKLSHSETINLRERISQSKGERERERKCSLREDPEGGQVESHSLCSSFVHSLNNYNSVWNFYIKKKK